MALDDTTVVTLIAKLGDAAAAITSAAAALSNATSAGSTANQTTAGASAGTSGSGVNLTGAGAQISLDPDIGTTETYTHNMKRTQDLFQTLDVDALHQNRTHFNNAMTAYQTHVANVNQLALQSIKDAQVASKVGDDRIWNVNITDALEALVVKTVAAKVDSLVAQAKAA